jgi:urease subunit alpha
MKLDRRTYADHYGPTTGDRVRLADTDLILHIERDWTVYGDEAKFGGGKVIRDGMGQSSCRRVATGAPTSSSHRSSCSTRPASTGRRRHQGRPHRGDRQIRQPCHGPSRPSLEMPASTRSSGEQPRRRARSTPRPFISPNLIPDAFHSGITTLIGGGTGPATGTKATTCTPGAWNLRRMYEAVEAFPLNFGFLGKGNGSDPAALREQVRAGALGLKLHEDWGSTPAALTAADGRR